MITAHSPRQLCWFLWLASAVLCLCTAFVVADTMRWPLVGDAALIHYICFLMDHGMVPYRDLGDMNMPGSFIIEWTVMHVLGSGALAWRVYDLLLMAAASGAMFWIVRPYSRFAAFFAASLFYLIHQRDGLAQGGQRDLTMAVTLLLATAALLDTLRRQQRWPFALFGVFAGIGLTLKPTAFLFVAGLIAFALYTLRRRRLAFTLSFSAMLSGLFFAPAAALLFLWKQAAILAFFEGLHTIVPYYASLGHRPLGYLLTHSVSPLLPLLVLWLALLAVARLPLRPERVALFGGVLFGLFSYVVQARGFPYYRYPLLAFLLPLMAVDCTAALRSARKAVRLFAIASVALGALFLAPISAWSVYRYDPANLDFITSLESTLNRLGGSRLSGHVQCIDSVSGCGTTLFRMRLVQATGVLSDFLLFGSVDEPVIRNTRAVFLNQISTTPPTVLVVTSPLHIDGPGNYAKLDLWPDLRAFLTSRYCLAQDWTPTRPQRWWSRSELPAGFRVYTLANSHIACPVSTLRNP